MSSAHILTTANACVAPCEKGERQSWKVKRAHASGDPILKALSDRCNGALTAEQLNLLTRRPPDLDPAWPSLTA